MSRHGLGHNRPTPPLMAGAASWRGMARVEALSRRRTALEHRIAELDARREALAELYGDGRRVGIALRDTEHDLTRAQAAMADLLRDLLDAARA